MAGIAKHLTTRLGVLASADEGQAAFRKRVFELLLGGYDRLPSRNLPDWEEEDITGALTEQIEAFLDDPKAPEWTIHYSLHEEPPVHSDNRRGKRRRQLDFRIDYHRTKPRRKFAIEAKRLCTGVSSSGQYVGNEGMGRFISGDYTKEQGEAGMLGYVQSHTVQRWQSKIGKKIETESKCLHVKNGMAWRKLPGKKPMPLCHVSEHDRPSVGLPIVIYHLMFAFC